MKVQLYLLHVLLWSGLFTSVLYADPMIIAQLHEPAPNMVHSVVKDYAHELAAKEEKINQTSISSLSRKVFKDYLAMHTLFQCEGILGLYYGYCMYSDRSGFLTFPLRHTPSNQLYVVICGSIVPQPIAQHTIGYIKLKDAQTPYEAYLFEKLQDRSKQSFWRVTKTKDAVTPDGIISNRALILYTKPSALFVQEGEFPAFEGSNIVFPPDIFVIQNKEDARRVTRTVDFLQYFEPIRFTTSQPTPEVKQQLMTNF